MKQQDTSMLKKILKIIKNIFYYGLIAVFLFIIIITVFVPGGTLDVIGVGWYRVVTNSMEKHIMVNDYIVVTSVDPDTLEYGDIIIFNTYIRRGGTYYEALVTHYYGGLDDEGNVLTYVHGRIHMEPGNEDKYDKWYSSPTERHYVSTEDIVGIHRFTVPSAGFISFTTFLFTNPVGWIIIIINGGMIYGIIYLFKTKKKQEISNNKDDLEQDSDENMG